MEYKKAAKYQTRVSEKYYLTENKKFLLVKLELVKPTELEFVAGQYVSIKVNERGERRSYSIVSTPDLTHGITLVAEMIDGGKGSEFWRATQVGEEVEILGPLGRFTVAGDTEIRERLLFVATGAGITPIKSMIEDLLINKHDTRPMRLHWGLRSEQDMFWFDNFGRLAEMHPNFVFDQVLSRPSEAWALCSGHVQDCLKRDFAEQGLGEWEVYVCGAPKTVEVVAEEIAALGTTPEHIHHEKFS